MTGKVTIVFQLILEEEQTGILERSADRNFGLKCRQELGRADSNAQNWHFSGNREERGYFLFR